MVTLLEIKQQARQRADQVNSEFVSDTELTSYINNSYAELYDLLVATDEDYFLLDVYFTLDGSAPTFPLPVDFYKLKGLDKALSGGSSDNDDWQTVDQFVFAERNRNKRGLSRLASRSLNVQYRVVANTIRVTPADFAPGSYRMWYVPKCPTLTLDTDVVDGINGFEEYIIVDAAIKMMQKEESDVSVLMMQKQALIRRIQSMAADRDIGSPERVGDVNTQEWTGLYPFRV